MTLYRLDGGMPLSVAACLTSMVVRPLHSRNQYRARPFGVRGEAGIGALLPGAHENTTA